MTEPPASIPVADNDSESATEQSELDLGILPTGNQTVDAALAGLDGLSAKPVDQHAQAYEQIHRDLNAAMRYTPDSDSPAERQAGDQTSP